MNNRPVASGLKLVGSMLAIALCGPSSSQASYLESPQARVFMDEMRIKHAFSQESLESWFGAAVREDSILQAMGRPAEGTMAWKDYRKIFVTEDRVRLGKIFMNEHADAFARVEKELGVSRYMVAAIIGVETRYGRVTGRHKVLNALSTLAFDYPPRSAFFREQLEHFLLLSREQHFDPRTLKGSYAGAMGYGQFMPGSYRNFAIDFDGDGVTNILDNPVDAIGSVANYFLQYGWKTNDPVTERVSPVAGLEGLMHEGLEARYTLADFRKLGLSPLASMPGATPVRLLRLEADNGEQLWLTYPNFYVITRYNRSSMYAMAVYDLSLALQATDTLAP